MQRKSGGWSRPPMGTRMQSSAVQARCLINKGQFHKTIHESPAWRGSQPSALRQNTAEWLLINVDRSASLLPYDRISDDGFRRSQACWLGDAADDLRGTSGFQPHLLKYRLHPLVPRQLQIQLEKPPLHALKLLDRQAVTFSRTRRPPGVIAGFVQESLHARNQTRSFLKNLRQRRFDKTFNGRYPRRINLHVPFRRSLLERCQGKPELIRIPDIDVWAHFTISRAIDSRYKPLFETNLIPTQPSFSQTKLQRLFTLVAGFITRKNSSVRSRSLIGLEARNLAPVAEMSFKRPFTTQVPSTAIAADSNPRSKLTRRAVRAFFFCMGQFHLSGIPLLRIVSQTTGNRPGCLFISLSVEIADHAVLQQGGTTSLCIMHVMFNKLSAQRTTLIRNPRRFLDDAGA